MKNRKSVIRLSRYKNELHRFKTQGAVRIVSNDLAYAVGVTASQVRKDFSLFGISGNRRGGYKIDELIAWLNKILRKDEVQKVIIVGAGNIGSALMQYSGFAKEGIQIIAGFDIDPLKCRRVGAVSIYPLEKLNAFVRDNGIGIGILAVPENAAQPVLDIMVGAGIKGVLNFAPIRLRAPEECVINSVNLVPELENVIYFSNAVREKSE
ncbi:MAG: redox-sensing transcriptional repressor Rex [Candidatus Omnitrophica bacterium]|jgi:AT-rich DNA-binding protein|nr:redox-sensing transcriptional repressor Rex [Candidatus Omnitrophota bacterium]